MSTPYHPQANGQVETPSLVCTTTPCPIAGCPLVMWKGSGVRVPCWSQSRAARAPARGLLPDCTSDPLAQARRVLPLLGYLVG
ncbi:unnamed protein product [Spirodela intermedia]|uniref:Uncharacterized protein n=1 Tax=Spirodela intermedia TaxID=51605 RepID=A0A7I8KV75_SPIIN|nr:unnamed protein product [Spirodela intermedia]